MNDCMQFRGIDVYRSLNSVAGHTAHAAIAGSPCSDSPLDSAMLAIRKASYQDSYDTNQFT
jgi:hypothetical protein